MKVYYCPKSNDILCLYFSEKPAEVDLEPTPRARVESGTFVRGSGQRSSWRLLPSVTQQVKEAMAAEQAKAEASERESDQHQVEETEQETGEISFQSEEDTTAEPQDSGSGEGQKPLRNVVLVAQDVEEEEGSTTSESVTMTFTIGSRGNQDTSNGDLVTSTTGVEGRGQSTLEQDTVRDSVDSSQNIIISSDQIQL